MFGFLILASALLGLDPASIEPDSYEAALAQVGRDADAQIRLALWCEAHGLEAERIKHLSLAVLKNPTHPLARGLLGLVSYRGRWQRPEAVGRTIAADPARKALVASYEARRSKLPETSEAHWKLALWCEEKGLKAESLAHLWSSVRLDPSRDTAWKRLGYKKHNGRWMNDAQIAREVDDLELQKRADRHWKPLMEKWRAMLTSKTPEKRAEAEENLAEVRDSLAVPAVWTLYASGDEVRQRAAVRIFGQIDAPNASLALAMMAVFSVSAEVRRTATETLARRDFREFGNALIGLIHDPIKYEVRSVGGPGSPGELLVHGKKANLKRLYSPPAIPNVPFGRGDQVQYDANGLPVVMHYAGVVGQTNRISVAELLSGIPSTSPIPGFHPNTSHPNAAQAQRVHAVMSQGGLGTWGSALEQEFLGNPALANAFSYAPAYSPNPLSLLQQFAANAVANGQLSPANGFVGTLGKEVVIPIGQMAVEAQRSAVSAQQQLQNDVAAIDRYNDPIVELNQRVVPILKHVSGQDLGADRETWEKWWVDQIGYSIMPLKVSDTPTIVENVPLDYEPQPVPVQEIVGIVGFHRMSCFAAGTLVHGLTGTRPIETIRVGDEVLTQDLKSGALGYRPVVAVHHNPPAKTFRITMRGEVLASSEFHRFWKAGKGWVMARDLNVGDTLRTLDGLARIDALEAGVVQPVFNLDVVEDADFFVGKGGILVHDNTLPDLRLLPFDSGAGLAAVTPR